MNDPTLSLADTSRSRTPGPGSQRPQRSRRVRGQAAGRGLQLRPLWTWPAPGRGENRPGAWPHERRGKGFLAHHEAWSVKRPLTDRPYPHGSRSRESIHVQTLSFVSFSIRSEQHCSLPGLHFCHRMIQRLLWIQRKRTKRRRSAGPSAPTGPAASGPRQLRVPSQGPTPMRVIRLSVATAWTGHVE